MRLCKSRWRDKLICIFLFFDKAVKYDICFIFSINKLKYYHSFLTKSVNSSATTFRRENSMINNDNIKNALELLK